MVPIRLESLARYFVLSVVLGSVSCTWIYGSKSRNVVSSSNASFSISVEGDLHTRTTGNSIRVRALLPSGALDTSYDQWVTLKALDKQGNILGASSLDVKASGGVADFGAFIVDVDTPEVFLEASGKNMTPARTGLQSAASTSLGVGGYEAGAAFVSPQLLALARGSRVHFFDVSNPETPDLKGMFLNSGTIVDIRYHKGKLWTLTDSEIHTIDLTKISSPQISYTYAHGAGAQLQKMEFTDTSVFLIESSGIVSIYNIENPKQFTQRTSFDPNPGLSSWSSLAVDSAGKRMSIQNGSWNYYYDITDENSPVLLGSLNTGVTSVWDLSLRAPAVYLTGSSGFRWLNYSNPASPTGLGSAGTWRGLTLSGNNLFVQGSTQLRAYDISTPTSPTLITNAAHAGSNINTSCRGAGTSNGSLLIPRGQCADSARRLIDISNPSAGMPTRAEFFNLATAAAVAQSGNYLFHVPQAGSRYLSVLDVSKPAIPKIIHRQIDSGSGTLVGLRVVGSALYVFSSSDQIRIYDISNPSVPAALGGFGPSFGLCDVSTSSFETKSHALISPYLYVATSGGDLQIFDVTNPLMPQHVQDIAGPDWCLLEASEGRLVNLRQFGAGVDIHTLTSPTVISSSEFFNPGVLVSRISTVGADLILLDEGSEVARWDISNPAAPVKKSSIVAWGVSEIVAFSDYLILGGPLFWNGVRMPSPTQFLADSASGGMTPVSIVRNEKFYFIASSEAALEVYLNKGGSPSR